MNMKSVNVPYLIMTLIVAQAFCATFFVWDVSHDGLTLGWASFKNMYFTIEVASALTLLGTIVFETRYLMALQRRKSHLERRVSIAASAFHDVIEEHFVRWRLTPSETDIAHFLVKGCSIAEIASLRGSAEGTIKSHLNAIYRKAGISNRGELLSLLIEDLMDISSPPPQDISRIAAQ